MAEGVEQVELDFWDWCAKVAERLTFLRLNVLDHRDISEADLDLLRVLWRPYTDGELPIYAGKMEGTAESCMQNSLFSEVLSVVDEVIHGGTEVDNTISEPKT